MSHSRDRLPPGTCTAGNGRLVAAAVLAIGLTIGFRARADDTAEYERLSAEITSQYEAQDFVQAEATARRLAALAERSFASHPATMVHAQHWLGVTLLGREKFAEAETLLRQALAKSESSADVAADSRILLQTNLADACLGLKRYAEAEKLFERALALARQEYGHERQEVVVLLARVADLMSRSRRFDAAATRFNEAIALAERVHGPDDVAVASVLAAAGESLTTAQRSRDAIPLYQRALRIHERASGPQSPETARCLSGLSSAESQAGQFQDAEKHLTTALNLLEKSVGPDHQDVQWALHSMGHLLHDQGRYREAAQVVSRALKIVESSQGARNALATHLLRDLAHQLDHEGRYAESEPLHRRALALREQVLGADDPQVAQSLNEVAAIAILQKQYDEAQRLASRALEIVERSAGKSSAEITESLRNLARVRHHLDDHAKAGSYLERALAVQQPALDDYAVNVTNIATELCCLYRDTKQFEQAERFGKQALAAAESLPDETKHRRDEVLKELAELYFAMGRLDDAESLVDDVVTNFDRVVHVPADRCACRVLRAKIAWQAGRRSEAFEDLREAQALAEQSRANIPGNERDRAAGFESLLEPFQLMIAWQAEAGDASEAFTAAERGRARSLLDELSLAGADLHVGRPLAEREQLIEQERELKARVAELERKIALSTSGDNRQSLEEQLEQARADYYEFYKEQRTSSPLFRSHLSAGSGPPRMRLIQQRVVPEQGLLLLYCLGNEASFVLSIRRDSAQIYPLAIDQQQSKSLAAPQGPLTLGVAEEILVGKSHGLMPRLASAAENNDVTGRLAALWQVLVPEPDRRAIQAGEITTLIVIPDGALSSLPFETLVLEAGETPRYLLDVDTAVLYAPSTTVLYNLQSARVTSKPEASEPVLSVGNPKYPALDPQRATQESSLELLSSSRRYRSGTQLAALPYADLEVGWVERVFRDTNSQTLALRSDQATEAGVRQLIAGRRLVHFACHGLVEQSLGNFFGALALTPGNNAARDPRDDGFLTLPEIYELNLKGCELAILSACQTNYGPQQAGEGVWALSRGFVVAGSRRVVASNWLVDDEAAASTVSYFCAGIARAEKDGKMPDYAAALHAAKRYIRQQSKWQQPYYWATFVLVGPN